MARQSTKTEKTVKTVKYLFPILALILSAALCAGGVFAWLANNGDLDSNGMTMTASTGANLVISAAKSSAAGGIFDADILNAGSPFAVTFTDAATEMEACTHAANAGDYNLKYCKTPEGIAYDSGLPLEGSLDTLLEPVPQESGYFRDYVVYIAADGAPLPGVDLTVTMAVTATDAAATPTDADTHRAVSIDFYVDAGSGVSQYRGTLNAAGLCIDNSGTAQTSLSIFTGTIPQNVSPDGCLTVTMRVYFDGNLQKPGSTATYVTSQSLSTAAAGISVHFAADPAGN